MSQNVISFKDSLPFYYYTKLEEAEEKKPNKSHLNEVIKGKWKYKWGEQKSPIKGIKISYKSREKVIKLFNDYS